MIEKNASEKQKFEFVDGSVVYLTMGQMAQIHDEYEILETQEFVYYNYGYNEEDSRKFAEEIRNIMWNNSDGIYDSALYEVLGGDKNEN